MKHLSDCRADFPLFSDTGKRGKRGKRLAYLDNAATTQRPQQVIDAVRSFYEHSNANVHRALYALSQEATALFENARKESARFVGAHDRGLVFTKSATESLNLAMYSWGMNNITEGDEILLTEMEHHSNLVPWQQLAIRKRARLKFVRVKDYVLDQEDFREQLTENTKLLCLNHASNTLGTIHPVVRMIKQAKKLGTFVVLDSTQAVPHVPVDFRETGADLMAFSSHKMLGPTGVGCLVGRPDVLEGMQPFQFGGDMITSVKKEESRWNSVPGKFEAGTPNVAGVVGFGAAVRYLRRLGMGNVKRHEQELLHEAVDKLSELRGMRLYLQEKLADNLGIVSFNLGNVHSHDAATVLDAENVAVRSGHHCTQVLMESLGLAATVRVSFYVYNNSQDIDMLVDGLKKVQKIFKV